MEVNKNQVYRVTHKPYINGISNSNLRPGNTLPAVPLPVKLLAEYVNSELGVTKNRGVDFINRIAPLVSLIDDDSGRVLFVESQQISKSTIYEFLQYFLRGKYSSDQNVISKPIDAELFLHTLKKAKVPASWLNYVKVMQ